MHRRELLTATALAAAAAAVVDNFGMSSARSAEAGAGMDGKNVNDLVVSYIATWNERVPDRRRALVASTWSESGTYTDAHRHGAGHDEIDRMIEAAQQHFPGYRP